MINKELETRLFLEGAKNLCINTFVAGLETKQYITRFNDIKDYETVDNKLVIGNGKYKALNVQVDWDKVKIQDGAIDKLFVLTDAGNILIESF
ncbi:hypothetical protein KQH81_07895 [Clostridium cadaveris]|uniref:hypothetical protein n=1 Tax=Clostridium cadaveris TaxID=1529 RepID=UPI001E536955|nr:hypothetical protein [Clostridium cadaveris]UFH66432.1 hypothetical protein KQH81_07895 [Clostridium cadaveris]